MRRKQRGMTLMELMAVVAIVGILTAIAYPSYRAQVRRSNRTEARVTLEQTASALEKCYTRYMAYNDTANCPLAEDLDTGTFNTPKGLYQISAPDLEATEFTLQAQALDGQASDTDCAQLTLDQTGRRSPAACW